MFIEIKINAIEDVKLAVDVDTEGGIKTKSNDDRKLWKWE